MIIIKPGTPILNLLIFLLLFSFSNSKAQNAKIKMLIYKSGAVIFERDIAEIDSVKFNKINSANLSVQVEEMLVYRYSTIYFKKDILEIDSVTFIKTGELLPLVVNGTITPSIVQGCSVADVPAATTIAALESLPGTLTIKQGCSGKDNLTVIHTDDVNVSCPVTISRTYTIIDACNNTADVIHQISVEDTNKPIITGALANITVTGTSVSSAPPVALSVGALEMLPGAITVNDNCTNKSNLAISSSDVITGNCPITINRTYTITDACNNSVSTVQKIIIQPDSQISRNAVFILGGTFVMGSPVSEKKWPGDPDNETQHQVTLSSFYMSQYEVSNAEFATFLNNRNVGADATYRQGIFPDKALINNNASRFEPWGIYYTGSSWRPYAGYENHPVVFVTWYGAVEYANYAGGRLPTEAEWEYACRAGTVTPFNTGYCLSDTQANYDWEYSYDNCINKQSFPWRTVAVDSYAPNTWGLYNMHGNVYEWCSDWYGEYSNSAQTNPTGSLAGTDKVIRGGSNSNVAHRVRSAYRNFRGPGYASSTIGIRVVFTCTTSN